MILDGSNALAILTGRFLDSSKVIEKRRDAQSSLDSTLMEDAGRLNLSSLSGLAGLLDAL